MSYFCNCGGFKVLKDIPCVRCSVKNKRPPAFLFSLIFLFFILGFMGSGKNGEKSNGIDIGKKVMIKDVSWEWARASSSNASNRITGVVAMFEIYNGSDFEVTNVVINCIHYDRAGAVLKSGQYIIDEKIKPNSEKFITKFDVEHESIEVYKSKCHVAEFK